MHIGDKKIEPADYPDVTSLGINFVKQRRAARNRSRHWPATGWTVRIDAAWKPELRRRLAELSQSITADTMYPPLPEVRRLALSVGRGAFHP